MYRVNVKNYDGEYPILEPADDELKIINPVLTLEMGAAGSFTFQVPTGHPFLDKLKVMESEITVYDDENTIFKGRIIRPVKDFYGRASVACEGELAYLLDSQQRPYLFTGNIPDFFKQVLTVHNSQVEERKQFIPGRVTVVDSNNYIRRENGALSNTLEALKGKLVDTHGGYLHPRREDGKRYLDYVDDYGGINSQPIRFGENLLDMSQYQDAAQLLTCLIPMGADIEITNPDGTPGTKTIDITSVNGGSDTIEHIEGIKRYGRITGTYKWEDVTEPENLMKKAKAYLDEAVALPTTLEISAVDLSLINVDIERLKLGYWTKVESIPHGLEKQFLLTKKVMHLDDPTKDTITLGRTLPTFTGGSIKQQIEASKKVEQVASNTSKEINRKVENATQLITGGLGGYVVISRASNGHPQEILVMDAPDKQAAKNVIRLNQNGLGFSTTGYNGVYRNAWTIDGNLVADFITAGTMLANRIRGGTLELGGFDNLNGILKILNAAGSQIGIWDKDGIRLNAGTSIVKLSPTGQSGALELSGDANIGGTAVKTVNYIDFDGIRLYENIDTPSTTYNTMIEPIGMNVYGETRDDVANYSTDCNAMNGSFDGDLSAYGEKNRIVRTTQYGDIKMAAYETASPMFGDIGSGVIGEDGSCYIGLDPELLEVVNTRCAYQVFVQAYEEGSLYVSGREPAYFIVQGTPGLHFAWEIKARQRGYEINRFDQHRGKMETKDRDDYAAAGLEHYKYYVEELIK